jgi:hypothetical protein
MEAGQAGMPDHSRINGQGADASLRSLDEYKQKLATKAVLGKKGYLSACQFDKHCILDRVSLRHFNVSVSIKW